jgi:dienelactone hydrolase
MNSFDDTDSPRTSLRKNDPLSATQYIVALVVWTALLIPVIIFWAFFRNAPLMYHFGLALIVVIQLFYIGYHSFCIIAFHLHAKRSITFFHATKRFKKGLKKVKYVFQDGMENVLTLPLREAIITMSVTSFVMTMIIVQVVEIGEDIGLGKLGVVMMVFLFTGLAIFVIDFIFKAGFYLITTWWSFIEPLRAQIPTQYVTLYIGSSLVMFAVLVSAGFAGNAAIGVLMLFLALVVFPAALTGSIAVLICLPVKSKHGLATTAGLCAFFGIGAVLCAGCLAVALWQFGTPGIDMNYPTLRRNDYMPPLLTQDPSEPGKYTVEYLLFGSGTDQRLQYGADAKIKTSTIDLSSLMKLSQYNTRYFGFTEKNLPINGLIWYPKNVQGIKLPVVVFVHGNHFSTSFSEAGYKYLGETLASQGIIAVSVDHNFINIDGFLTAATVGAYQPIQTLSKDIGSFEMMARAILILELLKQMRAWNNDAKSPLYGIIDTNNIGLMGHSRGGEAIAVAHHFNNQKVLTQFPRIKFDYGFGIKSLFSIAGTDGFYQNMGKELVLENVNYFAINGMYDADQQWFVNRRNYASTKLTNTCHVKSTLYLHTANHGQFNTDWGRFDTIPGISWLQNVRPLMPASDQEKIAKMYMSGFMRATLKGETQFLPMFKDYRAATAFLPNSTTLFNQYQDGCAVAIANFENEDLYTATMMNSTVQEYGFVEWGSVYILEVFTNALLLRSNATNTYTINVPATYAETLSLDIIKQTATKEIQLDLTNAQGTVTSHTISVLPTLTRELFKLAPPEPRIAFQTIHIPVKDTITKLSLTVTQSSFIIDNILLYNNCTSVINSCFTPGATILISSDKSSSTGESRSTSVKLE